MNSQIFLTGVGVISPLGLDADSFWQNLIANQSGIAPLTKLPTEGLRNPNGGEVCGFDWSRYGEEGDCDEASQFAYAAALEAANGAGLSEPQRARAGLVFATNFGGAASWEACCDIAREGDCDPETFTQFLPDAAVNYAARRWNSAAPRATLSNACSSGAHALGLAADWIALGRCDIAIAGGFDGLGISTLAGLSILRTISPDQIRPFDARRNGTIFGEGAAMVVLESERSMRARGAKPLAQFMGWSVTNNAHHLTAPDKNGAGLALSMKNALRNANVEPAQISYINAHGTGTQYNDVAETEAIKTVFGSHAQQLAVSSIKAATSHLMGAAGSLEAIATALALRDGMLPPTLNLEENDKNCDLDYVPLQARAANIEYALSNSSGIGGNNASLVLKKV